MVQGKSARVKVVLQKKVQNAWTSAQCNVAGCVWDLDSVCYDIGTESCNTTWTNAQCTTASCTPDCTGTGACC